MVGYTDSYHLHVAAFEVASESSGGGRLRVEIGIATAVTVVGFIDYALLFSIHGCGRRGCDVKGRRRWGGGREEGR